MNKEKLVLKGLCKKIRQVLMDSPSTAREVSDELDITPRQANVGIWMLQYDGQVFSDKKIPNNDSNPRARKTLKLYELTRRGIYLHKKKDQ